MGGCLIFFPTACHLRKWAGKFRFFIFSALLDVINNVSTFLDLVNLVKTEVFIRYIKSNLLFTILDTISVLKDGKVVEQGTYQNLLSIESGHFKSLVRK